VDLHHLLLAGFDRRTEYLADRVKSLPQRIPARRNNL
jgi:hypothetical protein